MANGASIALTLLLFFLLLAVLGILIYSVWFSPSAKAAASAATSNSSSPGAAGALRTIDVEGTGTYNATPDIALVNVGIETLAATVDEATQQNSARSAAVAQSISAVLGSNASAENLQTSQYTVTPVFATNNSNGGARNSSQQDLQQPIGFRVSHNFVVRIKDANVARNGASQQNGDSSSSQPSNNNNTNRLGSRASAVLAAATQAGANSVSGPTFQVSPTSPAHDRARELAVRDAERNAAELARLSGVARGPLQRISESSFVAFESSAPSQFRTLAASDGAALPPPIQSGTSQITYRVSASYAIGAADASNKAAGMSANRFSSAQ